MSQTTINTTDSPETGRQAINANFTELYATLGVKKYVAIVTQSGTNDPVATVLENSLGGTVVWARSGIGSYTATLAGAFTINKTICNPPTIDYDTYGLMQYSRTSSDAVIVTTYDISVYDSPVLTDSLLNGITLGLIVIQVYQ